MLFIYTLLVSLIVGTLALATLGTADNIAGDVTGTARTERAAAAGEAGLAYLVEEWRRTADTDPAHLDSLVGVPCTAGVGGSFELLEVRDLEMGPNVTGKAVRVLGTYVDPKDPSRPFRFVWRAILSPNITAPIQGVGSQSDQIWRAGSRFSTLGDGKGTVFGNAGIKVYGGAPNDASFSADEKTTIDGDVRMVGSVWTSEPGVISGSVSSEGVPVPFPDQQEIVNEVTSQVKARTASFWRDPLASMTIESTLTAAEAINADVTKLGSGWSSSRTPYMKHMLLRGGAARLTEGNYAFGRLWLDGTILTLKAPTDGATLVLADLYLTNGARLILDATQAPFTVVSPKNNVYYQSVGTSGGRRFNGSSWVSATPQLKMDGTTTAHLWYKESGVGPESDQPKPARGTTIGYDDWLIRDNSVLAVVTPEPNAKGFELYMQEGVDLILHNGARVMAGLQPENLATLKSQSTSIATLDALEQNAMGFIAWSGGGELPRLNINAGNGDVGNNESKRSYFTGLTYGGFEATLGSKATFTGAFVGQSVDTAGTLRYDARLGKLLTRKDPNTHHVVVKFREVDANQ